MVGVGSEVLPWSVDRAGAQVHAGAEQFVRRVESARSGRRSRLAVGASVEAIQAGALDHPDPFVRRRCLAFLDHYANEASTAVFARALHDPVEFVRNAALHSIACETCRTGALCAADVVPDLVDVLAGDPSPEIRHKAIPALLRLADRDPRARPAVERAAGGDEDDLVRAVAREALGGRHVRARKSYLRQRRAQRRRPRIHADP
jgi:HEAT repeats